MLDYDYKPPTEAVSSFMDTQNTALELVGLGELNTDRSNWLAEPDQFLDWEPPRIRAIRQIEEDYEGQSDL